MTPESKKKAEELMLVFIGIIGNNCEHAAYCDDKECKMICKVDYKTAQQCAIKCCEEMINLEPIGHPSPRTWANHIEYWQSVIESIKQLK